MSDIDDNIVSCSTVPGRRLAPELSLECSEAMYGALLDFILLMRLFLGEMGKNLSSRLKLVPNID